MKSLGCCFSGSSQKQKQKQQQKQQEEDAGSLTSKRSRGPTPGRKRHQLRKQRDDRSLASSSSVTSHSRKLQPSPSYSSTTGCDDTSSVCTMSSDETVKQGSRSSSRSRSGSRVNYTPHKITKEEHISLCSTAITVRSTRRNLKKSILKRSKTEKKESADNNNKGKSKDKNDAAFLSALAAINIDSQQQ